MMFITLGLLIFGDAVLAVLAGDGRAHLLEELPAYLVFSNNTGGRVRCLVSDAGAGAGAGLITWLDMHNHPVGTIPGLREFEGKWTLWFPPFKREEYRDEVHRTVYRCRASNQRGGLVSRSVIILAEIETETETETRPTIDTVTSQGHITILRLRLRLPVPPPSTSSGLTLQHVYTDRYTLDTCSYNGRTLDANIMKIIDSSHVSVNTSMIGSSVGTVSCGVFDRVRQVRYNSEPVHIKSTSHGHPHPQYQHKITMFPNTDITQLNGTNITLFCITVPPSPLKWFRETRGYRESVKVQSGDRDDWMLRIVNLQDEHTGVWGCSAGDMTSTITLTIIRPITITVHHLHSQHQQGHRVRCDVDDGSVTAHPVEWWLEGNPITNPTTDNQIEVTESGLYQCTVGPTLHHYSHQASVLLSIRDTGPVLADTFIERVLRDGGQVSLRCSATGRPRVTFAWYRDRQPIQTHLYNTYRYALGEHVNDEGEVVSHLNISNVITEDGGLYTCLASNTVGQAKHSARLNIYGAPYIRLIPPVKAVYGSNYSVHCPYSGYPISSIVWERGDAVLKRVNEDHLEESALVIEEVKEDDAGTYLCTVTGPQGEAVKRDLHLQVVKPPVVGEFIFPGDVVEGSNIQATCSVMSGDQPIHFTWIKDRETLPSSLQFEQKHLDFFSILIIKNVSGIHSGNYTCIASNSVAEANHTARLLVKVAPKWKVQPHNTTALQGTSVKIQCLADGYPLPQVTWYRGKDIDERMVLVDNGNIIIPSVTSKHEGFYTCRVYNAKELRKTIYLTVNKPPTFLTKSKDIYVRKSENIVLECQVYGDKPLKVIWTHNNNQLNHNNYRYVTSETIIDDSVQSLLTIKQTNRKDTGHFRCQAQNTFGKNELVFNVNVQEKPDPPDNLHVARVESRNIQVSWKKPYDGNSLILFYLIEYCVWNNNRHNNKMSCDMQTSSSANITINNNNTLIPDNMDTTITQLKPATTYIIRILANNVISNSDFTHYILAKTREEAPSGHPQNIEAKATTSKEIHVTWTPPPETTWNGELLGYNIYCRLDNNNNNNNNNRTDKIRILGPDQREFTIKRLSSNTKYYISMTVFNRIAEGPTTLPISIYTLQGEPENPPEDVKCHGSSPTSVTLNWNQIPNTIVQGYNVYYRTDEADNIETRQTITTNIVLNALESYTTYVIQIKGFTVTGEGPPSPPLFCTTKQYVPDSPQGIKTAYVNDEIIITWIPPLVTNGIIIFYTVYMQEYGKNVQSYKHAVNNTKEDVVVTGEQMFKIKLFKESQIYDIWITASTVAGEGKPTKRVTTKASSAEAGVTIMSFGGDVKVGAGKGVILPCRGVGTPPPRTRWLRDTHTPITHHRPFLVSPQAELYITKAEAAVSGRFTCVSSNSAGEESISYDLVVLQPPEVPPLLLPLTADTAALALQLAIQPQPQPRNTPPLLGYALKYRHDSREEWATVERRVGIWREDVVHVTRLKCGSLYHVFVTPYNRVGTGKPSQLLTISTLGSVGKAPVESECLYSNSTCILIKLSSWDNGGCEFSHFSVEYKMTGSFHWIASNDLVYPLPEYYSLSDLVPATWYHLRIVAYNEAGETKAYFRYATTTLTGDRISDLPAVDADSSASEYLEDIIILSLLCVFIIITIGIISLLLVKKTNRRRNNENENYKTCKQIYSSTSFHSNDKKDIDLSDVNEISPYATFNVNEDDCTLQYETSLQQMEHYHSDRNYEQPQQQHHCKRHHKQCKIPPRDDSDENNSFRSYQYSLNVMTVRKTKKSVAEM